MTENQWQIYHYHDIPDWFCAEVNHLTNRNKSNYLTKLLWGRGIRDSQQLQWFLDTNNYQSPSPFEFGREITQGLKRLEKAWNQNEKVAIWGSYNIDGVTATCVLWEGLKPFFPIENNLIYYISHSLNDCHGLTYQGIDSLQKKGVNLLITADMGSDNLQEIDYAQNFGMDIIIIDHHTLPDDRAVYDRPKVISFLNPLNFAENHPFYHLSGVTIAYKLLEALYQQFPHISSQPLTDLLDLVAIGLLADGVKLKGDCRYLAREGIKILQQTKRSGIDILVKLCQDNGDRPMDISLGIAQRINAINYTDHNSNFAFQLLTTRDEKLGENLAKKAEKAHFNVKDLHKQILKQVKKKIETLDLSNTAVIILTESQWEVSFLPLIAKIISQEYNRATILLSTEDNSMIAKGYGCSIKNINLTDLVTYPQELLDSFSQYHDMIKLSLSVENIALFRDSLNQQLRSKINVNSLQPIINIDLVVTIAELGEKLRHELRLIEPSSVDNPNVKLLIKNCYFKNITHKNQSYKNQTYKNQRDKNEKKEGEYIKTSFTIYDKKSPNINFEGIWLGHYSNEINPDFAYDVVVELDFNFTNKEYYVRIIDLKFSQEKSYFYSTIKSLPSIIDHRSQIPLLDVNNSRDILLDKCPFQWQEITENYQTAVINDKNLVLAYHHDEKINSEELWQKFIKIIKNLIKENKAIEIQQLLEEIAISQLSLNYILDALEKIGIVYVVIENKINFQQIFHTFLPETYHQVKQQFEDIIKQENLQKSYFYQVPVLTIEEEII